MTIGDEIQVQINGGPTGLTLGTPPGSTITIAANQFMSVSGIITADLGAQWQVKLNMTIGGNNLMDVPK